MFTGAVALEGVNVAEGAAARSQHSRKQGIVGGIKSECPNLPMGGQMCGIDGADDGRCYCGPVKDGARGDGGYIGGMFLGNSS